MKIKEVKKAKSPLKQNGKVEEMAIIGLTILLCGTGLWESYTENFEIAPVGKVESVGFLLEDANSEWKTYKEKISVTYEVEGRNYQNVLIMGLEEEQENQKTYRSLTIPEYTLVEINDKENNSIEYILQDKSICPESEIENFSENHIVTSVAWCISGDQIENFEEIKNQEQISETIKNKTIEFPSLLSQTDQTLLKYNDWLQKNGSNKRLTTEDLRIIEAQTNSHPEDLFSKTILGTISIKINSNEYRQVGANEYNFVETIDGNLELRFSNLPFDMLTGKDAPYINEDTMISTFGEYIIDNEIEPIGYTTQSLSAWSDEDTVFIRENYGEDILECLRANGFPLPCYDVNDFYKAYYESKFAFSKLGR